MKEQTTIATRLRRLMNEQGLGENELARRCKVPQPTIHRILTGTSKSPRIENLEKISAALGTSVSYLAHGATPPTAAESVGQAKKGGLPPFMANGAVTASGQSRHLFRYPILSWSEAMRPDKAQQGTSQKHWALEPSAYSGLGVTFWLRVGGDAMAAPIGVSPSLPEGTLVLLDTELPATPGKLVLATYPDHPEPILRQLIDDSGHRYLKPLNPSYPLITLENECQILAVAVEARIKL